MQKQSKEDTVMCENLFVVNCWSIHESCIKALSGFISAPALTLETVSRDTVYWGMFPSPHYLRQCYMGENRAEFSFPHCFSATQEVTLAVLSARYAGSSFPYPCSSWACWLSHMGKAGQKAVMGAGKPTGSSAVAARALLSAASLGDSTSGTAQRTEPESLVLERYVCSTSIDTEVTVPVAVFQTHNLRHSTVQLHAWESRVTKQGSYQIKHKHIQIYVFCGPEHFCY